MSTHQPNADVRVLAVSPDTADVLRIETKKVLMFNHEYFEDFLDDVPVGTPINPDLLAEITTDRLAAGALDRLIGTYEMTFRP
jgi:hypothetical protein